MSYINATLLNDLQGSNVTNDKRFSQLGYVDLVADSTPAVDYILPSQIAAMNTMSSLRNQKIPVIKDQTVSVGTTPGFNYIPANLEESDQYSFVAYDVFSGFRHYPSTYASNMIDEKAAVEIKTKNVCYAMGQSIETILSTIMEARKSQQLGSTTQLSQGDGTFSFSTSTDTLTVNKAAQKETMFFNLTALMAANELPGDYRIVTNRAGLAVQKAEQLKYSVANEKNLAALGMFPLDHMYESANVSAGSDVFTGFLVRDGAIGLVENFPYDFVNGTEIAGKKWSISDVEMPFTRMRVNVYVNREATDATALITSGTDSNSIMSHFEEIAFWARFYVVYRYNGDLANRANDIVKIVGTTT
jgi:hypothetical protein